MLNRAQLDDVVMRLVIIFIFFEGGDCNSLGGKRSAGNEFDTFDTCEVKVTKLVLLFPPKAV